MSFLKGKQLKEGIDNPLFYYAKTFNWYLKSIVEMVVKEWGFFKMVLKNVEK